MEFKRGADVLSFDGKKIGKIDRFVIDPCTKEITHLVMHKGFLFHEDKVVPVDLVDRASEDEVTLKAVAGELNLLPFEENHYMHVDESDSLYHYKPVGGPIMDYPERIPHAEFVRYTSLNIPRHTVAVEEGAKVISADAKHVGNVERLFTDEVTDQATHLVISKGLLLKVEKMIPISWVCAISEDKILLAVDAHTLEELPEFVGV